jgi:flagellar biosynthesis protein FlhG
LVIYMDSGGAKFWTFGGGKGGVGKSFLTASVGVALAQMGKSVIVVDADLGAANLHTYLGIKNPDFTLLDILENRVPVEGGLLKTAVPGLRLISCAGDILGMANPDSDRKDKIIEFIRGLQADYVLVDLGAGTSYNVLDFFNMSDEGIVIVSPDPPSMQNAYAFLKSAVYRRIEREFSTNQTVLQALERCREGDQTARPRTMMEYYEILCATDPAIAEKVASLVDAFQPLMIVNMAGSVQEQKVAEIIQSASRRFLSVNIRFAGLIVADPAVRRASQRMEILELRDDGCEAGQQILRAVTCLLNCSNADETLAHPDTARQAPTTPTMGLNDNLDFMGRQFHIQTEDLGYTGRSITTQVFCNGRVLLSTKSEYPESLHNPNSKNQIAELMRRQHFNVIRELEKKKSEILSST